MANKTKIYCVYCGTENILEDKKCKKCKKQLNPKNRPFRDYILDKLKDKVEGDIQDNIFSLIIEFIKSHLYGSVLTCSIIFTVVAGIVSSFDNTSNFDKVSERPFFSVNLEYKGEGLSPEEIVNKYGDALNSGNLKEAKSYELKTFHPDVFEKLKGSNFEKDGIVHFSFVDTNKLLETSAMVFRQEKEYGVSFYYASSPPKGKYGDYEFIRHPLYIEYNYGEIVYSPYDKTHEAYAFDYSIEFIKVDDNYYISGTQLDPLLSIEHEIIYDFFIKYQGDTTKFSYADITKYIDEIDG
jgi:hypothetical protein